MRRLLFSIVTSLSVIVSFAQTEVALGYCAGEVAEQGSISVEGKQWVSAAIYVPADMLKPYSGCNITTLRAALATKINVDSLRIWIREDLKGENLAMGVITSQTTPKLAKGWNDFTLENPYAIEGKDGLYIGMSYRQKAATSALSVVGSPLKNACFVKLGDDAKWEDFSDAGILSVEAIVQGDNLPDYDLALYSAIARPSRDASTTTMNVTVINNGKQPLTGFTLTTAYEKNASSSQTNHFDSPLSLGEKTTVTYDIPSMSTVSNGDIVVNISALDNAEDQTSANNTIKAKMALVKKLLIEEYTTEPCGNCPRVAGYLHTVLDNPKYDNRIVAVCHHAGYKTDWLTQPCDEKLAGYYGVGFAPAMQFDRRPLFSGSTYICPELSDIENNADKCLEEDAHVSIRISAKYNEEDNKLSVAVSGVRDELSFSDPRLTVYVVENNIPHKRQTSAPAGFMHQHVIRCFNSAYGDEMNWLGNQYENTYTFDLDPEWNKDNIQIIAFVNNMSSSKDKNIVDNAESANFPDGSVDAIAEIIDNPISTSYYTIDGTAVTKNQMRKGIYVVRTTNTNGQTSIRKILVK